MSKQTALLTTVLPPTQVPWVTASGSRSKLERAVGVERAVLGCLVLGERRRVDVAAALEHEHLASATGELVGERRASGAAADDHDVGIHRFSADVPGVQAVEPGRRRDVRHGGLRALRERHVAAGGGGARILVVAEIGHLRGGVQEVLRTGRRRSHQRRSPTSMTRRWRT